VSTRPLIISGTFTDAAGRIAVASVTVAVNDPVPPSAHEGFLQRAKGVLKK